MPRPADCKLFGEQAECAFIWQAARHGLLVSIPYGASGPYDLIVQPRRCSRHRPPLWCVQVKCTGVKRSSGIYSVHARRHSRAYLDSEIDFLAAWVIPEDAWYIIPIAALPDVGLINLYPHRHRRRGGYEQYREAWHLLL